jgi:iron-sulfur cluster repair protein YtfE (RIC family)
MSTVPTVTHEHHARLHPHVDRLAATASIIATGRDPELLAELDEVSAFLNGLLSQHMETAERVLFPELERLMQNRHSMTPARREHAEIRALIAELDRQRANVATGHVPMAAAIALRRSLYRLFGLLKIHLAEEQLYADIVEHGLSPEAEAMLAAAMHHEG